MRLVVRLEPVDPDHHPLAVLDLPLIPIARRRDLGLRETRLDRRDHAAHFVDAADVVVGGRLRIERQLLQEVAAAERVRRASATPLS